MKTMKFLMLITSLSLAIFLFYSCDDNDDDYSLGDVWGSIATVKPLNENSHSYSLILDNGTTLWPAANHVPWYTPKVNQRAIVYYTILSDQFQGYDHAILVRNISNILTKYPAKDLGNDENDNLYGSDPVNILDMWIGDGYLNVWFGFNYGGNATHFINLVHINDSISPYYFEFRHNGYNDTERVGQKGLAAFNLSSLNVEDEVNLIIKVNTFSGDKEYTIKYDPTLKNISDIKSFSEGDFVELN